MRTFTGISIGFLYSYSLNSYNGIIICNRKPTADVICLDASLNGLDGCFNNLVYALPIPQGFRDCVIFHLEMVNVIVALKLWGPLWANAKVRTQCDNHFK